MENAIGSSVDLPGTAPTYAICGVETPVAKAVANLLGVFGCKEAEIGDASIAILDHLGNFSLSQDVLRFYHHGLNGGAKRVIYFEGGGAKGPATPQIPDPDGASWFSPITDASALVPSISTWLLAPLAERSGGPSLITPSVCNDLVRTVLAVPRNPDEDRSEWNRLLKDPRGIAFPSVEIQKRWQELLKTDTAAFYYSLACVAEDHLSRDHEEKGTFDRELFNATSASEATTFCTVLQAKRFRETAEDLRASLADRVLPPPDGLDCILLIDDDPQDYLPALQKIRDVFFPDYELWHCKLDYEHERLLHLLAEYRSADHVGDSVETVLGELSLTRVCPTETDVDQPKTLVNLLTRVGFVLMDQVYRTAGGRGELFGPALTRGLLRLLRDLTNDPKETSHRRPPELVALSRTEDSAVIQNALRAGARDYVVKSRLLSLPSVLAKLQRTVTDPPHHLHRTFRALTRLPNDTIGLLQAIKIPQLPLHRRPEDLKKDGDNAPSQPLPGAPEIAELLTILPKPDLHVHMGSCMSTEFLVVASLVGLLRHEWSDDRFSSLSQLVALLHRLRSEKGSAVTHFIQELSPSPVFIRDTETPLKDETWIKALARHTAKHLGCQLACDGPLTSGYGIFRAILHADLGIPDYLEIGAAQKKLDLKTPLELALFAVQHSIAINNTWKVDDIIRVYLLTLATLYQNNKGVKASLNFGVKGSEVDFLDFFRSTPSSKAVSASSSIWRAGHQYFYSSESQSGFTVGQFRGRGWRLDGNHVNNLILTWPCVVEADDHSQAGFDPKLFPIEFELATGLHSTSLVKYLQGCEFSGAEKLRHPFLIHLYAQQTVMEFVRMGVFYAELKGSPDGFIEHDWGFEFSGVCRCLVEAFAQAQASVLDVYRVCRRPRNRLTQEGQSDPGADPCWLGHSLGERFSHSNLREMFTEGPNQTNRSFLKRRLPCKVSLVFVGKRHKSTREMILEAAAAAVMRPSGERPVRNAREFVEREMARCRVVGFDLAGQESDNPPELFVEEFSRLSRLHIPFTVHAGENAPAKFIEDAILLLQAKRIGHGLALAEDQGLMVRVREDRVCVELCPVCNHQTSHFLPGNSKGPGRRYPLKDYLEYGLLVAINTDNPIISNTNLVREYFQASYAYDDKGLSVWEALRVMRMGYVCSFLRLPERRAMIETVEQFLFDLFSREDCVAYLREIADLQRSRRKDARIKPPEAGGRA